MSQEHPEELLMKVVDGLLSEEERQQLDRHLRGCPSCREELRDFGRIKETTDAMTARILGDAHIEAPRPGSGKRRFLTSVWLSLALGCLLLLGFAGYGLGRDPQMPTVVKIALGLLALGVAALLAYVLGVRWRARGRDSYEEIDR
jgi:anti-sigma factor RsiW